MSSRLLTPLHGWPWPVDAGWDDPDAMEESPHEVAPAAFADVLRVKSWEIEATYAGSAGTAPWSWSGIVAAGTRRTDTELGGTVVDGDGWQTLADAVERRGWSEAGLGPMGIASLRVEEAGVPVGEGGSPYNYRLSIALQTPRWSFAAEDPARPAWQAVAVGGGAEGGYAWVQVGGGTIDPGKSLEWGDDWTTTFDAQPWVPDEGLWTITVRAEGYFDA